MGMNDEQVGMLNLWTSTISAGSMVLGGWVSDIYLAGMSLPVLYLMGVLQTHGYVMPRTPGGPPIRNWSRRCGSPRWPIRCSRA
jgi:hypothetical protein